MKTIEGLRLNKRIKIKSVIDLRVEMMKSMRMGQSRGVEALEERLLPTI